MHNLRFLSNAISQYEASMRNDFFSTDFLKNISSKENIFFYSYHKLESLHAIMQLNNFFQSLIK